MNSLSRTSQVRDMTQQMRERLEKTVTKKEIIRYVIERHMLSPRDGT